jgi:hypothetical protein
MLFTATVKAPNFDRVYSILMLDDHPLKKLTGRVKSRSLKFQNRNLYSEIHGAAKKFFSEDVEVPSVLLTSTGTNIL